MRCDCVALENTSGQDHETPNDTLHRTGIPLALRSPTSEFER